LEQEAPHGNGKTYAAVIAEALVALARKGDVRAISELTSRIEGKPVQSLSVGYEDPLKDLTYGQLEDRIQELEKGLRLTPSENSTK
jgi:hypothetical protein